MAVKPKVVDRDKGWHRLKGIVEMLSGKPHAKVGVLADDEKGGLHVEGGELTEAEIAAVLEFGTEDGLIPERSFIRATFDMEKEALAVTARKLIVGVLDGTQTVTGALNVLGAQLSTAIRERVTTGAGVPPPNAPSTALAKAMTGRTAKHFAGEGARARSFGEALAQAGAVAAVRPLVDTGRMINAVTWAVITSALAGKLGKALPPKSE